METHFATIWESIADAVPERDAIVQGDRRVQWGDYDTALVWLENARKIRDPGIIQSAGDPLLYPLRDDPRFQQILQDAGHVRE